MSAVVQTDRRPLAYASSAEHVLDELRRIDLLLAAAVCLVRQEVNEGIPGDLRGLVIGEQQVDSLVARPGFIAQRWLRRTESSGQVCELRVQAESLRVGLDRRIEDSTSAGRILGLVELAQRFELAPVEVDILLLALAPELDPTYDTLFAYLHDDVTRKRPSVGLMLDVLCRNLDEVLQLRHLFEPDARLLTHGLMELSEDSSERGASGLRRQVRLADPVATFLLAPPLGASRAGELITTEGGAWENELDAVSAKRLRTVAQMLTRAARGLVVQIESNDEIVLRAAAALIAAQLGRKLVLAHDFSEKVLTTLPALIRDAALSRGILALMIAPAPGEQSGSTSGFWRAFAGVDEPLLLLTTATTPASTSPDVRLWRVPVHAPDFTARQHNWERAAARASADLDVPRLADAFAFGQQRIVQVMELASGMAAARGGILGMNDVLEAGRMMSSPHLGRLALRIQPRYTWADLVLPPEKLMQLHQAATWLRHRRTVHQDWGFGEKLSRGKGMVVLFTGPSGTGKTMAAEVLAYDLGLELFQIDLSSVVSKYIGETEKNLSNIFGEAERSQAVLFFDEADALFGKRTEVKDAHDRYANIEVNYLLQRVEQYAGIVILATNLQSNLDDAFLRRMKHIVEFPFPDETLREQIWRSHFPPAMPRSDDVDFGFLARQFKLPGGSIKNVVLNAAFAAAEQGAALSMRHVITAIRNELQKEGKLCVKSDFGPYFELVQAARHGN